MIENNYLAMIDCDYNVAFNDVQILKYIFLISFWIELVTKNIHITNVMFSFLICNDSVKNKNRG
jgi:hypothetical protein